MIAPALFFRSKLFWILSLKFQMFFMPIGLIPMIRRVVFNEILYSSAKLGRLQQDQLYDERTYLSFTT